MELFMEDDEARDRAEQPKRSPKHKQGESIPEGANAGDADAPPAAGEGSVGDSGGVSRGGGSSGSGGGASQGGGSGN